jgi:hypothetical protein
MRWKRRDEINEEIFIQSVYKCKIIIIIITNDIIQRIYLISPFAKVRKWRWWNEKFIALVLSVFHSLPISYT